MEIIECNNFMETSYRIIIKEDENINAFDVAESFKAQYPKEKAVICFSEKKVEIKIGLLIVGLNLK
jgi:hypothetical protein